ncbi:MAG: RNA polymerase sigma factor [Spirochaetota bacterium]
MQRASDATNFKKVYEAAFPVLIRIAFHITGDMSVAEDLCQEAFIRYYNRMSPLPNLEETKYWLIHVIKNLSFNYENKKKREKKAFSRILQLPQAAVESGETEVIKQETKEIVRTALQKLPYKLRSVLVLREYGQLNYKEIAKILGITEGNVKVRVFRAREMLGDLIKQGENNVP